MGTMPSTYRVTPPEPEANSLVVKKGGGILQFHDLALAESSQEFRSMRRYSPI